MRAILAACLALLIAMPMAGEARNRNDDSFDETAAFGFPLSFRSERGGRFEPERLVVLGRDGAWVAALPANARARSADHLDFSGLPVVGGLFQDRVAPSDAERKGQQIGIVSRIGDTLVLDARSQAMPVTGRRLLLTSALPRVGTVTFDVGRPDFRPGRAPTSAGTRVGVAYLVDGALVLAADGQRPPITDWSRILGR